MKRYVIVKYIHSNGMLLYFVLDKFDKSDSSRYFLQMYDHIYYREEVSFELETNDKQLAENKVNLLNKISKLLQ